MQTIKRDLILGVSMCALVFACALVWGSPFVSGDSGPAPAHAGQQARTRDVAVFGTIVKQGDRCVLEDAAGKVYELDGRANALIDAQGCDGKSVEVTGELNEQAGTIYVARIEIVPA